MIKGVLPIGIAFRKDDSDHYDYYISPKLFWEVTGYVYKGNIQNTWKFFYESRSRKCIAGVH